MDFSYNSDWNDYVKIECEKLRKKGHIFDAVGTHMKIIAIKYQKKKEKEERKAKADAAKQRKADADAAKQRKAKADAVFEAARREELAKENAIADAAYYAHMQEKADAEKQRKAKADAEFEAARLEDMRRKDLLKVRAKQQEELAKSAAVLEANRREEQAKAKQAFTMMEQSLKNLQDFKDGKIIGVLV